MSSYIQESFNQICQDAIECNQEWYVCLMEKVQFYGGPEEGGWWGTNSILIGYQLFLTEELANKAKEAIENLAKELSQESQKEYGQQCLRETKWLEARGLDDSFLPEPDGPSEFYVIVSNEMPENKYDNRHYE